MIAGISDLARPAEKLSLTQNLALTATGTIWTRWCFIIRPQNYLYDSDNIGRMACANGLSLATVNFFLALVGIAQVSRILAYRRSVQGKNPAEVIKEEAKQSI